MSDRTVVIFETRDIEAEERLLREYVVPAVRRLDDRDEIRWVMFNRYGADPSVDGGEVTLSLFGECESVVAEERPHWDALVTDGVAAAWWIDDTEIRIDEFDDAEVLRHRMRATASRMSLAFFEEFDELPDATDEFDRAEEQDFATGAWMWLHHLLNQLGYQANDGEEEIDLLFEDIRSRLYAIAAGVATARAERKVDELVTELEALPAAMRQSLGEGGEHEHRYATREQLDDE